MVIRQGFYHFVWFMIGVVTLTSCSRPENDSSRLNISLPKAGAMKTLATNSSWNDANACFAVNVTAADISPRRIASPQSCDLQIGHFAGFAGPGQTLSLPVKKGSKRKLELFAFVREGSEPACPAQADLGALSRKRLMLVGVIEEFDANQDEVVLTVNLAVPGDGVNLISQYGLASSCANGGGTNPSYGGKSGAGFTLGQQVASGGSYKLLGSLSSVSNQNSLTGGGYKMVLLRKTKNE